MSDEHQRQGDRPNDDFQLPTGTASNPSNGGGQEPSSGSSLAASTSTPPPQEKRKKQSAESSKRNRERNKQRMQELEQNVAQQKAQLTEIEEELKQEKERRNNAELREATANAQASIWATRYSDLKDQVKEMKQARMLMEEQARQNAILIRRLENTKMPSASSAPSSSSSRPGAANAEQQQQYDHHRHYHQSQHNQPQHNQLQQQLPSDSSSELQRLFGDLGNNTLISLQNAPQDATGDALPSIGVPSPPPTNRHAPSPPLGADSSIPSSIGHEDMARLPMAQLPVLFQSMLAGLENDNLLSRPGQRLGDTEQANHERPLEADEFVRKFLGATRSVSDELYPAKRPKQGPS